MLVKELLPKLKANKNTYYNLGKQEKERFKNAYNYLKKHKEKSIYTFCLTDFYSNLENTKFIEYVQKIRAIEVLSMNINHSPF